ncbi:MAG: N-acetylglucosamine-6-phosphate deacetylase [Butyrivibrio sp.]|nr:N-acetylglucosamine-6-phosphate deacetylase [Butyrivibrio sp.]
MGNVIKIVNGKIFLEDFKFHDGELLIRDGKIAEVCVDGKASSESGDGEVIDARGGYVIPGLIDMHLHGAMGDDVCDVKAEAFDTLAKYELENGITSICPATLTLSEEDLAQTLSLGADFADKEKASDEVIGAELIGFNMEGPFISYAKKGAQNPNFIKKADIKMAERFVEAGRGLVKVMGLAPEESENFREYIEAMKGKVRISLCHTNSDYETAKEAIASGASHAIHLYNGMSGFTHRSPGVVGAVFDSEYVTAELICDPIHLHPAAVRTAFRELGDDRIVLISDSLRSTGMADGFYTLGGQDIKKEGARCTLIEGGAIAGSVTNLFDCMVNAIRNMNVPLESAVKCATRNPAKVLGVADRLGTIEKGKQADVLIVSDNLKLEKVIKRGKIM